VKAESPANSPWLTLGQIATAHGIRGWLLVQSYADPPDSLLDHPIWQLLPPGGASRSIRLVEGAPYQQRLRVRLEGIEDRTAALALSGWWVQIARASLGPLRRGEYYRDDLLGFAVRNVDDVALGTVAYFADLPAGTVMVVRHATGHEYWVPMSPQHLLQVLAAERWLRVDWPAQVMTESG
jgi:16S rRNA processing protein RimM